MSAFLKMNSWNFWVKGSLPVGVFCLVLPDGMREPYIIYKSYSHKQQVMPLELSKRIPALAKPSHHQYSGRGAQMGSSLGGQGSFRTHLNPWNLRLDYKAKGALQL